MFVLVFRNRLSVRKFIKKVAGKGRVVVVSTALGVFIFFSRMETAHGMGLSPIPQTPIPIDRIINNKDSYTKFASIPPTKVEKIRVTNEQINNLALQLNSGLITMDQAITQLRGDGGLTDVAAVFAFVIFVNWYNSFFGVEAFQANPLPHQDPFGWLNGKYDRKPTQHINYKSSRFELEMTGVNDNMYSGLPIADENGFVMSYEEAGNLVAETYPGFLQITNEQTIDYWQACKKIDHAIGFGINPEDYGMNQKELMKISRPGGLIRYVQDGNRLPPIEFVKKYASTIKDSCLDKDVFKNEDGSHKVKDVKKPAVIFSLEENRHKITFDKETGSFVSGQRVRKNSFEKYIASIKNYPRQN